MIDTSPVHVVKREIARLMRSARGIPQGALDAIDKEMTPAEWHALSLRLQSLAVNANHCSMLAFGEHCRRVAVEESKG